MQTYGFHFVGYVGGKKDPIYRTYTFKDSETLTKGDMLNLESGEVDLFATGGDTGLIGIADETKTGVDSTTTIRVIWDANGQAIYRVTDANARTEGTLLDITGTTGAQTVGADGDTDLIVVANSAADEPTYVRSVIRSRGEPTS